MGWQRITCFIVVGVWCALQNESNATDGGMRMSSVAWKFGPASYFQRSQVSAPNKHELGSAMETGASGRSSGP